MQAMELLKKWQATQSVELALVTIRVQDCFQPRCVESLQAGKAHSWRRASAEHVNALRDRLEHHLRLDPILVADINSELFVVDGHHRLRAYRASNRQKIPARVMTVTHTEALQVSTLANACAPRSLKMEDEHLREALWRYMGSLLEHGNNPSAKLPSQRTLAKHFGVPQATVQRMIKKAREHCGNPSRLGQSEEWPSYRDIAMSAFKAMREELDLQLGPGSAEAHRRNRALERVAHRHRQSIEAVGIAETLRMLEHVLRDHATEEAREARQRIAELMEVEWEFDSADCEF